MPICGIKEDMLIPLICLRTDFEPEKTIRNISVFDITTAVTELTGVDANVEWEGKSLLC